MIVQEGDFSQRKGVQDLYTVNPTYYSRVGILRLPFPPVSFFSPPSLLSFILSF